MIYSVNRKRNKLIAWTRESGREGTYITSRPLTKKTKKERKREKDKQEEEGREFCDGRRIRKEKKRKEEGKVSKRKKAKNWYNASISGLASEKIHPPPSPPSPVGTSRALIT